LTSYVDGAWLPATGPLEDDVNPARPSEVVARFSVAGAGELRAAVDAADAAFPAWRSTPIQRRGELLRDAAASLRARSERLAIELTREQGKTLAESRAELRRAAEILDYYAGQATASDGEHYPSPRAGEEIWALRAPVGPVGIITPWNVPLGIPVWKIAPALVYGNTVVWKPARLVPLLARRFMEALIEAGLPPGVCNMVLAGGPAGSELLTNPRVRACSFTGSTEVGRQLIALGAQHGVKVQAEMGGKNAAIVLADADLDWAADQVLDAAMLSTGQRCTATSRALVERRLYPAFVDALVDRARALRVGDPLSAESQIGPLASAGQRRQVLEYFAAATVQGATLVAGGNAIETADGGYYVEPTVAVDVEPDHRIFMEEVFGPLVAVVPFDTAEEAFALANRGPYGLSAAVFTGDLSTATSAVQQLEVGVLHVNSETCGADPHVPFGGVKASGSAHREMGTAARDFYTEIKTVYMRGRRP
jgi:aldehyde dehydrogenase (NAD+)